MDDIIKRKIRPGKKAREIHSPRVKARYKGAKSTKHEHTWDRRNMNIGGRANLLEEMGRIDARRHPDAADRAEKRRVIGELNRGYKKGGLIKGKPKIAKKGWK